MACPPGTHVLQITQSRPSASAPAGDGPGQPLRSRRAGGSGGHGAGVCKKGPEKKGPGLPRRDPGKPARVQALRENAPAGNTRHREEGSAFRSAPRRLRNWESQERPLSPEQHPASCFIFVLTALGTHREIGKCPPRDADQGKYGQE